MIVTTFVLLLLISSALCASPSAGTQSACQAHAERERKLNSELNLIPKCNADGSYADLQCFGRSVRGGNFCSCWDRDGTPQSSPSRTTKACECQRQIRELNRLHKNAPPPGTFVPQCEANGTFKKKQIHGSTGQSWCADPQAGTVNGSKVGPGQSINCD